MSTPAGQDLFRQGIAQFKSGNYQEASDLFLNITDHDPGNHKAWNALGVVYTTTGRFEEADECYKKALLLSPDSAPYLRNLERNRVNIEPKESVPFEVISEEADNLLKKARVLIDLDNHQEALVAFDQALRVSPNNAEIWYEKGQSLFELNKYEEAIAAFDQAIRIDPDKFYVYDSKAQILRYELNRQEESLEVYNQAIKNLLAYNSKLYQKGLEYDALREFDTRDDSLKVLDQVITNISLCYSMLHRKGDGLYNIGRFEEAIETFDQVIRLNTEYAWVHYSQGALLSLIPKMDEGPEEAIKVFNNANEKFRHLEKTYYLKGLALGRLGKYDEAIASINQAIRIDPKYAHAIRKDD